MQTANLSEVEQLAERLSTKEQLILMERLVKRLQILLQSPRRPQNLYGIWRDRIPGECDIDDALKEIRSSWLQQFDVK
jgi:hypothetical protein